MKSQHALELGILLPLPPTLLRLEVLRDASRGFAHTKQAPYQLSYNPSPLQSFPSKARRLICISLWVEGHQNGGYIYSVYLLEATKQLCLYVRGPAP